MGVGNGSWQRWLTVAANTTELRFFDATSGQTYRFTGRAKKGRKYSDFSNRPLVGMPR